jgi:hypothetical protein
VAKTGTLRASVGSTEASASLLARVGVVGPTRARSGRRLKRSDLDKSSGRPTEAGCHAAGEAAYRWLMDEQKVPEGEV